MSNVSKDFVTKNGIVVKGNSIVTNFVGQSNALQVDSGAAIAKNLLVGSTATIYGIARIANSTAAIGTDTGALVVDGGLAVAQDITVGGTVYADSITGLISTATNLAGGTAGQILYQSSPGVTAFAGPGTTGQVLISGSTAGPNYQNTLTVNGGVITINSKISSTSTTTGSLVVDGGVGVSGSMYVGDRMGFVNTGNYSIVYQVYNPVSNTLDTVWG